jgi:hypothetical protein
VLKRITRNSYLYFTSSIFHYRKSHVVVQCFVCSYPYLRALWPIFQIVVSFSCQHTLLSDENNNIRIQLEVTTWYPYHITDFFFNIWLFCQFTYTCTRTDPGFQVNFFGGVFRVKNHDFTPKNHIFFPILGGARARCAPPPPCMYKNR